MADFNLGFSLYEPVFFVVVVDESLTISYFLDLREVGVRPQRESIAFLAQSNLILTIALIAKRRSLSPLPILYRSVPSCIERWYRPVKEISLLRQRITYFIQDLVFTQ